MEYILVLVAAVLVGFIPERRAPNRTWSRVYWALLGLAVVFQCIFMPYRVFRIWHDLSHLF